MESGIKILLIAMIVLILIAVAVLVVPMIRVYNEGIERNSQKQFVCPDGSFVNNPNLCPEIQESETKSEILDMCNLVKSYIPESRCPTGSGSASHIQDEASEIECSIHKILDFEDKMFSFFKTEYLASIDSSELDVSYSDCTGGITESDCKGTSRYNCILTNEEVTRIVYDSPAPCIQYNVFILPKQDPLESVLKPEHASSIEDGVFSAEPICDTYGCLENKRFTIFESNDNLILKEWHITCP